MKCVNKKLAAGMIFLGQTLTGAAFAASVTLSGTTVDFSFDDTLLGLFGAPTVAGDILSFTPTNFFAESFDGDGIDRTHATLNVKITAHDNWDFSRVDLTEYGDYEMVGNGAKVAVKGQIRVFDTMNPLVKRSASIRPSTPFMPTDDIETVDWEANASIKLGGMATASMINVTLQNILQARSPRNTDTLAFIEKKYAGLSVITTPVPEPETYAMLLAGLGLVGFAARRRAAV